MGAGNTITIDFSLITGSLAIGQVYQGGFFLDDNTVTNASFSNANFVYVGTGGATIQYDGLVAISTANFATGTVFNGEEMQFGEVIPQEAKHVCDDLQRFRNAHRLPEDPPPPQQPVSAGLDQREKANPKPDL